MRTDDPALLESLLDRLRDLAESDSGHATPDFTSEDGARFEGVFPEDLAEAIVRLEPELRASALAKLEPETAAYVLIELPTETARAIVRELPDATVAHYLDVLPMDDALDLREELGPDRFESLLRVIPEEDAEEIRRLQSYPEESAGRLMTEDFLAVSPETTMDGVLGAIRAAGDRVETVNTIYVLSGDRHLLGVLTLRRILRAEPLATAREIMNPDPVSAPVEAPEEEAARTLARYGFTALPILDRRGRMVGIVTADDAQDILQESETETVLALGAVTGDAEAYLSLSVWELVKRRLPWLMILFLAEFFTGNVLRYYTPHAADDDPGNALSIIAKLNFFVPLLIGAGGNAGSQVTTTITRALALGEVRGQDWLRVMRRELVVSFLCGAVLGGVGFLRSSLSVPILGYNQPVYISLVIAAVLPCIIMWAATVGSLLPIAAKRIGLDPAVMSAPFITTFVDATGLIIFFEVAKRIVGAYGHRF